MTRLGIRIDMETTSPMVDLKVILLQRLQLVSQLSFWVLKVEEPGKGGVVGEQQEFPPIEI